MEGSSFDRLARAMARAQSRRAVAKALGFGGAAAWLGHAFAAGSAHLPAGTEARAQAVGTPTAGAIQDLAFGLEFDVEQIFRFVRDRVAYDPYPGILRGARGTLEGLAGNAVDQALLLSELLRAAQVETRFVAGELSEADAARLLAAASLAPAAAKARAQRLYAPATGATDGSETTPIAATTAAAPSPSEEAFRQQFPAFAKRVLATIDSHTSDGIATVTEALKQAGITLPAPAPTLPKIERQQHVWLQYANGPEWVDLDPSLPGTEPGHAVATKPTVLTALPDDLVHRITFRLVAEQVAASGVARNELLRFEAPSRDLLGVPLTLLHPQPDAMQQVGVAVSGLIEGFRNFVPSLLVGEQTIFGTPVTFATGGGAADVLGGGPVTGDTLAEWLEVTVTTPSGARTATRTVFDRVGETARTAGPVDPTKVAPIDFVQSDGQESSFLPLAGLWSFTVVAGDVPEQLVAQALPKQPTVTELLPALHAYHYARDVAAMRTSALASTRLYVDAPNVTTFVLRPEAVGTGRDQAGIGLDLLHRSLSAAPGASATSVHPLVAAGALAHAVEQAMFETGNLAPLKLPVTQVSSVDQVFAAAKTQGIAVLVLRPGDTQAPRPQLAAGPRQLVNEALKAGRVVIVPARPVSLGGQPRIGWWLVEPATGATVDQMDDGGGSVMVEEGYTLIRVAGCAVAFAALGLVYGEIARFAAAAVNGNAAAGVDYNSTMGSLVAGMGGSYGMAVCAY